MGERLFANLKLQLYVCFLDYQFRDMGLSCFWQPVTIKALLVYGSWGGLRCGMPWSQLVILLFSLTIGKLLQKHACSASCKLMLSRILHILSSILSSTYYSARYSHNAVSYHHLFSYFLEHYMYLTRDLQRRSLWPVKHRELQ